MTRLGARHRAILAAVAVVALGVAVYLLLHQPLTRQLGELAREIERQERLLQQGRERARLVAGLEAELGELREISAALERDLPVTKRAAELLQYLDDCQRRTGVRVMALEFGAGEPVQQYVRYPVDFVVEGSFPAQTQFLSLVERVPRLALVERLKVEPMATAGQVTATYTLYLYVDERRPATAADLEDLVFRRQPGRPNPFLPPAR